MPFQRVTTVLSMLNFSEHCMMNHHRVEQQEPMRMDSLPDIRLLCKAKSSIHGTQFQNIIFARLRRAKKEEDKEIQK